MNPPPIRTKIICTMGPAVRSYEQIVALIQAGMNVARLNFSHGSHEEHKEVIDWLKTARQELKVPLAILLDTKGPEVRIGDLATPTVTLHKNARWHLVREQLLGDEEKVSITPPSVLERLVVGTKVLFDDGYLSGTVVEETSEGVIVEFTVGGTIKGRRGVNVPNASLHLPAVTEKDVEDIRFGCEQDVDLIAASFIRSADHVVRIKRLLQEFGKPEIMLIAKIENHEGVDHFDSIVQAADGIMVARGDLGVEVPLCQVPKLQKMMIRKCYLSGKPVVTATQMLESMITSPRPTRAETSDVANAIYDSTSCVMLSGETAVGKYPVQVVEQMVEIVAAAENDFNYRAFFDHHATLSYHDVPSAVTLATVKTSYSSQAKAIFVFTSSGATARLISRLRPKMPIIALTSKEKTFHQLAFSWGIVPLLRSCETLTQAFSEASTFALEHQMAHFGDLVVVNAGTPFGIKGTTNMMIVESIGDVLVRGEKGFGGSVHGNVRIVLSPTAKKPYEVHGHIIVLTHCEASFEPLIKECAGIVLENHIDDTLSEESAITLATKYNLPLILRADRSSTTLKEGQLVTLFPEKGLVYKGVVL